MIYGFHTYETHMLLRHKSRETVSYNIYLNPNKFELVFNRLGRCKMTSIFPHTNQTNN